MQQKLGKEEPKKPEKTGFEFVRKQFVKPEFGFSCLAPTVGRRALVFSFCSFGRLAN